jgi:hypothetical protein
MGWSIGFDSNWHRDVGYGVPAMCDYPDCGKQIDRGLGYICGDDIYGGSVGCGLFFCEAHLQEWKVTENGLRRVCERCVLGVDPFMPTADVPEWLKHKLNDASWLIWRDENPDEVAEIVRQFKVLEEKQ